MVENRHEKGMKNFLIVFQLLPSYEFEYWKSFARKLILRTDDDKGHKGY